MARREQPDAVDMIVQQWAEQRPDLDVTPMHVLGRLHRSFLHYQMLLNELFDRYSLNMASFDVLAALRRSGPPFRMTAGELAQSSLVTSGGITLRVDRLEQAGLVQREGDVADRRIVYARLTERGKQVVDDVSQAHFTNEKLMLTGLTTADCRQLAGLLRKLEESITRHESEAGPRTSRLPAGPRRS